MTVTGPAELLATWEAGLAERGAARALLLHRAARPDAAPNALASVPLGERAADLFTLRRALFGDRMEITLSCTVPGCGAALECELDAGELAAARPRPPEDGLRVDEGEWTVRFRLPTPADLAAVAAARAPDGTAARRRPAGGARAARPSGWCTYRSAGWRSVRPAPNGPRPAPVRRAPSGGRPR